MDRVDALDQVGMLGGEPRAEFADLRRVQVVDAPQVRGVQPPDFLGDVAQAAYLGRVQVNLFPRAEFEAPGWITPLAITVAVGGIVLAWLTYQRRAVDAQKLSDAFGLIRDAAIRRFWLDDLYAGVYRRVILGLSRFIGWIDRYLVDGLVNLLSAWTLRFADWLRGIQTGVPQDYVYAVALGVLLLFVWSQWAG